MGASGPIRWVLVASLLGLCAPATAFTIQSGFSDGCHESLIVTAYRDYLSTLTPTDVPIPESEEWRKLSEALRDDLRFEFRNEEQRLVLISLLVGVREPDTNGHSLLNLTELREAHMSPNGQYEHALRAPQDDGPAGDVAAVEGTRALILERIGRARASRSRPPAEQIVRTSIYIDFYGKVDVEVWEPAFRLGQASHALQDSFAHMIRSDDLRRVIHVANYLDAIVGGHDEARDGLAHSDRLDDCTGATAPIYAAAREATIALMLAAVRADFPDVRGVVGPTPEEVLDQWLTFEPGCGAANDYCESFWAKLAREKLTGPYLSTFFGCRATGGGASSGGRPLGLLVTCLLVTCLLVTGRLFTSLLGRRRRRPR